MSENNFDNNKNDELHGNTEEHYDLYREKIVSNPWKKVKKFIKYVARIIGSAVLFGIVASVVIALIYPNIKRFMAEEEPTTRPVVVIPTDSQNVESTEDTKQEITESEGESESHQENESIPLETDTQQAATEESSTAIVENDRVELEAIMDDKIKYAFEMYNPGVGELNLMYKELNFVLSDLNKSMVTVTALPNENALANLAYSAGAELSGFIVAEDDDYFYVMTLYDFVKSGAYTAVTFNDGTKMVADFVMGDKTTNLAVLSCEKSLFEELKANVVHVAALGNSYLVQQGEAVLLTGNIYGQPNAAAYGMISATRNTLMDTDSNYRILMTNIAAANKDFGIVANVSGEVIGVIIPQRDGISNMVVSAYGISELKLLIGRMVNGIATPYIGVQPQTVTPTMQLLYNMPKGVYVDSVEADSPAYISGIQSGDVITAVNGENVTNLSGLQNIVYSLEAGSAVEFAISRPGRDEYREIVINLELSVE